MPGTTQDLGAKAASMKPKVDPWARSNAADRFAGPGSLNYQAHKEVSDKQRSASPAAPKPRPPAASSAAKKTRASSAPKARLRTA